MRAINLLPWRAERRLSRRRWFYAQLLLVATGVLSLCSGYGLLVRADIDQQQKRLSLLQQGVSGLDERIKAQQKLQLWMSRAEQVLAFQQQGEMMIRLLEVFAQSPPTGLAYTSLTRTADQFNLQGIARHINEVTTLVRHLQQSPWLAQVALEGVRDVGDSDNHRFTLELIQASIKTPISISDQQSQEP